MYPPSFPRCRFYTRLYPPTSSASPKLYLFLSRAPFPPLLYLYCLLNDYPAILLVTVFKQTLCSSPPHIIHYIYLVSRLFRLLYFFSINDFSTPSAFTEGSEKTIPFHNMQYTLFYFILCSCFFWLSSIFLLLSLAVL